MKKDKKTIFITGGGTGGHIYPAVAIYNSLKNEDFNLYYIGNKKKLEFDICKKEGFNFLSTNVSAMPRKIGLSFILWLFNTFFASLKALIYFIKYKPCVVFATGGYVSAPTLICANVLKVPYMLHDCDAYPGIVSRAFARNATKISTAFESAKLHLKNNNIEFNGNPIRESFSKKTKIDARFEMNISQNDFVLLVMGGSQGAKSINEATLKLINEYKDKKDFRIILQTGAKNYQECIDKIESIPPNTIIKPYFDDMTLPLIACDLVISRAGSLSISEICASNSPSILVPYPFAAKDHQRLNARKLEEIGASIYLEDSDCTFENLKCIIDDLLLNSEKLNAMKKCAQENARLNATLNIKNQLLEVIKK
ncbi:MAG: undecaprenyldiphospho-muramoylpentapeptide beta-N-acetylglucosaminyltransferase [Cyanobacteria bacterium SIG30]|nr:undecaprenyldiphospho-muramoylpentapeptide beta-N-acetylglucosaminyltransferase [Cyanobacteria bacterium SIG30]